MNRLWLTEFRHDIYQDIKYQKSETQIFYIKYSEIKKKIKLKNLWMLTYQ